MISNILRLFYVCGLLSNVAHDRGSDKSRFHLRKESTSAYSYVDFIVETSLCIKWLSRGAISRRCASGNFFLHQLYLLYFSLDEAL